MYFIFECFLYICNVIYYNMNQKNKEIQRLIDIVRNQRGEYMSWFIDDTRERLLSMAPECPEIYYHIGLSYSEYMDEKDPVEEAARNYDKGAKLGDLCCKAALSILRYKESEHLKQNMSNYSSINRKEYEDDIIKYADEGVYIAIIEKTHWNVSDKELISLMCKAYSAEYPVYKTEYELCAPSLCTLFNSIEENRNTIRKYASERLLRLLNIYRNFTENRRVELSVDPYDVYDAHILSEDIHLLKRLAVNFSFMPAYERYFSIFEPPAVETENGPVKYNVPWSKMNIFKHGLAAGFLDFKAIEIMERYYAFDGDYMEDDMFYGEFVNPLKELSDNGSLNACYFLMTIYGIYEFEPEKVVIYMKKLIDSGLSFYASSICDTISYMVDDNDFDVSEFPEDIKNYLDYYYYG